MPCMLSVVTAAAVRDQRTELEARSAAVGSGRTCCGAPETQFGVVVLSFVVFAAVGSWLLMRTQFGSWIMAVGGNKEAARSVGVPAARTKTTLFMLVSAAAWITGNADRFPAHRRAGRRGRRQRVPLHHRRRCGRQPADRRVRIGARCGHRSLDLGHDLPGHRLRPMEQRLEIPGPRSPSAGDRRAGQQLRARPSREGAGQGPVPPNPTRPGSPSSCPRDLPVQRRTRNEHRIPRAS